MCCGARPRLGQARVLRGAGECVAWPGPNLVRPEPCEARPRPTSLASAHWALCTRKRAKLYKASIKLTDVVVSSAGSPQACAAPASKAALAGSDRAHVHSRWEGKGRCVCKTGTVPCHRDISFESLYRFCMAWHNLSATEKWLLMLTQYTGAQEQLKGETGPTKVNWYIQGVPVCFTNFCHLLAVGPMTVRGYLKEAPAVPTPRGCDDARGARGRPREQAPLVDFFFMELYNSSGEPLAKQAKEGHRGTDADIVLHDSPWLDICDSLNPGEDQDWDPAPPDVSKLTMLTAAAAGGPVVGLRERYIQHTTVSILYWQFLATWDTLKGQVPEHRGKGAEEKLGQPPCYNTFRARYKEVWRHYLKIRQPTEHAQCIFCFRMQRIIMDGSQSLEARREAAAAMQKHQRDQYTDRALYWNLRLASQVHGDVLVIIVDAMDKAKFAWPRWPWERKPKDLADLCRPRMDFTAVLAHGYCAGLFMSAETLSHGSDFCIDVLCRTIQHVQEICRRRGAPLPRHLVIQSDNTVAQAKNQWVCLWLSWLVAQGHFETATLNFLRVGHTHEDIDQFFSLIVSLILKCHHFEAPEELLAFLQKELQPKFQAKHEDPGILPAPFVQGRDCMAGAVSHVVFMRMRCAPRAQPRKLAICSMRIVQSCSFAQGAQRVRREELRTEIVTGLRDWQGWICGLNRTISQCFMNRQGHEAPHSFIFKLGRNLRPAERQWLGQGQRGTDEVYALVKDYMSSPDLRQAPEVVLPTGRCTATPVPEMVCARLPLGAKTIQDYTKLALKCREHGLDTAAAALQRLMFDLSYHLPPLPWLQDPAVRFRWAQVPGEGRQAAGSNRFFPHLPSTFDLLARDRRATS